MHKDLSKLVTSSKQLVTMFSSLCKTQGTVCKWQILQLHVCAADNEIFHHPAKLCFTQRTFCPRINWWLLHPSCCSINYLPKTMHN